MSLQPADPIRGRWFMAHLLINDFAAARKLIREAYDSGDDVKQMDALTDFRSKCRVWLRSIDSVLPEEDVQ